MRILLSTLLAGFLAVNAQAKSVNVGGFDFEDTVSIEGHELSRLGAGVRSKFIIKVYALAVYSETKSCDPMDIILEDEAKYMKLVVMMRELPGSMISGALKDSIEKKYA